jgi:hypothetical protein
VRSDFAHRRNLASNAGQFRLRQPPWSIGSGVWSITVYDRSGHIPTGGLSVPTKTMFHDPPVHLPTPAFFERHCCDPELTWPSIMNDE